jgi:hypothetical protein
LEFNTIKTENRKMGEWEECEYDNQRAQRLR